MKKLTLIFVAMTAICASASAQYLEIPDREEVSPGSGVYGVLHTENYEYTCDSVTTEPALPGKPAESFKQKVWLDLDFKADAEAETAYRVATAFPGNGKVGKFIGAEATIAEVSNGRCGLDLCLDLTLQNPETGEKSIKFEFRTENGIVSVKGYDLETNTVETTGVCEQY
jgi:hypothetical protein